LRPSGSLALFCSFGLLSISGPPGPPSHYRYPTYRTTTHQSWGKPKLNMFFSFPIPHMGAFYTKVTQPMARESYTSSTLGGTDPPNRVGFRLASSPIHHEDKEQVQFWSTPRWAFTFWHVTFPYIFHDDTVLSMTTPLATVRACSRRLQPRINSILFSFMTNTADGIHLTLIFSY